MAKRFEEEDIPDWTETSLKKKPALLELVLTRQDAADKIAEAEEVKKECSYKILGMLSASNVPKVQVDDYVVSIVTTNRRSLNESMLKAALIEAGVKSSTIAKLWEECSSTSQSSYVKVTSTHGEKDV